MKFHYAMKIKWNNSVEYEIENIATYPIQLYDFRGISDFCIIFINSLVEIWTDFFLHTHFHKKSTITET